MLKKTTKKNTKKVASKKATTKAVKKTPKIVAKTATKKTAAPKKKTATAKTSKTKKSTATKSAAKKSTAKKMVNKPIKSSAAKSKPTATVPATSLLGQTVAPFSVFNSKGEALTQETLKGRKAVLYFYPKDDTPGCTLEGQQFSQLAPEFTDANTVVFGVSKDSVESHDKFICKYDFKIDLISDEKEQLCQIFDVIKEKNMYGKKYMGIERSTFVLDENLKVVKEMRKVSPEGHAQEVLEFIKSL
jgi:peroxiredoxin Q/BCP